MDLSANPWPRLPLTVRALLAGLAVTCAGSVPWIALAAANAQLAPQVPWAAPLALAWLVAWWRWLAGSGPPHASAAARRDLLTIRPLDRPTWAWALLATAAGFAALVAIVLALTRVAPLLPRAGASDLGRFPLALVLASIVATAVVSAVTEEAGFRGVMQSLLDRRFGPIASTAIVAVAFGLFHLSHGWVPARLAIDAVASVVLSITVRRTGSIRPGIFVHAASDIVVPLAVWLPRDTALAGATLPGADATFALGCAAGAGCLALAAWSDARLRRALATSRAAHP